MRAVTCWRTIIFLAGLAGCGAASAEGGSCPPGSYPVGGKGASGCAPIPGGGGQGANNDLPPMPPRQTGRWHSRYGAIAQSKSTAVAGSSAGRESAEEALTEALEQCGIEGARDCEILLTYSNQCAAWVIPKVEGSGSRTGIAAGKTIRQAKKNAEGLCKDPKGGKCEVFHSACSNPFFEKF